MVQLARRRGGMLLPIGLLFAAMGCGGVSVVPVSGRVTLDDKPLPGATVVFSPLSEERNPGPGSRGKTDANGQYKLSLMAGEGEGAMVGKHIVRITAYEGGDAIPSSGSDMKPSKALVPAEYNRNSTLKFDVPAGGTTKADFPLKSAP